MRRMGKEFSGLQGDKQIEGVTVEKDEANQDVWYVTIQGPKDTPYQGGEFRVKITFPENYPYKSPDFVFETKIFHPNVNDQGEMCKDILNKDNWNPTSQVKDILITIVSMFSYPSLEMPLNLQAGKLFTDNNAEFIKQASDYTQKYAQPKK